MRRWQRAGGTWCVWALCTALCTAAYAQEQSPDALLAQACTAPTTEQAFRRCGEVFASYQDAHRYNEFVELLAAKESKADPQVAPVLQYYRALARFRQLRSLEETQNWNEYFGSGQAYRQQLHAALTMAIEGAHASTLVGLYSRLLLFETAVKDEDLAAGESALVELLSSAAAYAKAAPEPAALKAVAQTLANDGKKSEARQCYKLYIATLLTKETLPAQLVKTAEDFFQEGNLELAELVYDQYLERVTSLPKEEAAAVLIEAAKKFSAKDDAKVDPAYAERLFAALEQLAGKDVFNQELIYLRAFNLEKIKEYPQAADVYLALVSRYPDSPHVDEATYKAAMLRTYCLGKKEEGKALFTALAGKETLSPQALASVYQLGLLSQWEGDAQKAAEYYNLLLKKAGEGAVAETARAQERLSELGAEKPLAHNLQVFLDASLKSTAAYHGQVGIQAAPLNAAVNQPITVASSSYRPANGCLPVEVEYLWSGALGAMATTSLPTPSFQATYRQQGTMEINLVVVSATGVLDYGMAFVDVR